MPPSPHELAFDTWIADADRDPRQQPPTEELLAEHHLMTAVLAAMEVESHAMLCGRWLRPAFWRDLVDFNDNFVHRCHRVKEEDHLIPVMVRHGLLDPHQDEVISHEHDTATDLTLGIGEGVGEGDWEKVVRLTSIYLHLLRPHLRREEANLFVPAAAKLPAHAMQELREAFDLVDRQALAGRGRHHYVAIANRLSAACSTG